MKEVNKRKKVRKLTEEQLQMIATQVWIFLFGFCIGCAMVMPDKFWWLPLFVIVLLIVARKWIHRNRNKFKLKGSKWEDGIKMDKGEKINLAISVIAIIISLSVYFLK